MLNKNKNNDIHGLIMDQLTDVENTLVALEGFIAAATAEGATVEPLRALCKTVREKEHIADVSLRTMIEGLDGPFLPSTRAPARYIRFFAFPPFPAMKRCRTSF